MRAEGFIARGREAVVEAREEGLCRGWLGVDLGCALGSPRGGPIGPILALNCIVEAVWGKEGDRGVGGGRLHRMRSQSTDLLVAETIHES